MKSKSVDIVAGILIFIGILLLIGTVGESDMYDEMGQYLPLVATIRKTIIGSVILLVGVIMKKGTK